ncbi:hypothetical protein B7755_022015 [Streptomyces sp. NBS 14/10]|uniref:hypothetical protein n=1 Tax=Streptomyces sp. NBS 14/10 TaxID=1945643 RepID=UPI000B7EC2DF|nr:hypothetical protein [Streptomyces sp. NBS 14/10]KAK1180581.1 hypothetical protein B7755_022015 [Streptomyces sp. NBS 14/10]NUS87814.1 hypothetical protein [Streptomyces sp.]
MLIAGPRVRMFAGAGLLVTAAMLATACQSWDDASGQSGGSSASAKAATMTVAVAGKDTGSGSSTKSFTATDEGTQDGVGAEAGPAEQAVGEQITLGKGIIAYAGVNPKTTKENGGKELNAIIVGVGVDDANPVSLPVDTVTVDKPTVTNWHTFAADAVPFDGGTDQ